MPRVDKKEVSVSGPNLYIGHRPERRGPARQYLEMVERLTTPPAQRVLPEDRVPDD